MVKTYDGTHVLLVNPNLMKPAVAPIGLDYLAHALRRQGYELELLDLCFVDDPFQAIDNYFAVHQPSVICFSIRNLDDTCLFRSSFFLPPFKELLGHIRRRVTGPIILGGVGFSIMPEEILGYCEVDYGIWGDGEESLPQFVFCWMGGGDLSQVPNLIYRRGERFRRNGRSFADLTHLGVPARDTIDNQRYFREGGMGNIETKRGCPMRCIYCADPLGKGRTYRLRPSRDVVDELEGLLAQGIDHFHLCDAEFNLPEEHARAVCQEMVRRDLGNRLRWYAYASPVPLSDGLATLFRQAGCAGINFGVDCGTDPMLKRTGRNFSVADLVRTGAICHRQGRVFMYDLLLGGPGETKESIRATRELMRRIAPHRVGAAMGVRVLPHAPLARQLLKEGPLTANPNLLGDLTQAIPFFAPVFYLSAQMGDEGPSYLTELVAGDERFFLMSPSGEGSQDYNYNDNTLLVDAIRNGYRGAYWDILRRWREAT